MFDIGFWELGLISLISLIILGPQRLPHTVRTVLSYWKRAKQFSSNIGSKLENELGLEPISQQLNQQHYRQTELKEALPIPKIHPRQSSSSKAEPVSSNETQTPQQEGKNQ